MKYLHTLLAALLLTSFCNTTQAQQLKEGDIIFQQVPCGKFCDAIIETTPCKPGRAFNHCGIVHMDKGTPYVIEAISKGVQQTPLSDFLKRDTSKHIYIGRLKKPYTATVPDAITKAESYIGHPYDKPYLPGDSALYCSELVWQSYRVDGEPIFPLKPMTFISPKTGVTYAAWTEYYAQLHMPIPEGVPGINPCAIANNDKLTVIVIDK